jgi:hypothetical protein
MRVVPLACGVGKEPSALGLDLGVCPQSTASQNNQDKESSE